MRVNVVKHALASPHEANHHHRQVEEQLQRQSSDAHCQGLEIRGEHIQVTCFNRTAVDELGHVGTVQPDVGHRNCENQKQQAQYRINCQRNPCEDSQHFVAKPHKQPQDDAADAVEKHDVAKEQKQHVRDAEQPQERITLYDDHSRPRPWKVPPGQTADNESDTETEQRCEHRQPAIVCGHSGKKHGGLVGDAVVYDAAEECSGQLGACNQPGSGNVRDSDAEKSESARSVGDEHARSGVGARAGAAVSHSSNVKDLREGTQVGGGRRLLQEPCDISKSDIVSKIDTSNNDVLGFGCSSKRPAE